MYEFGIGHPAKFGAFRPHKDRTWAEFWTHFRPHKDRTLLSIKQGPPPSPSCATLLISFPSLRCPTVSHGFCFLPHRHRLRRRRTWYDTVLIRYIQYPFFNFIYIIIGQGPISWPCIDNADSSSRSSSSAIPLVTHYREVQFFS